MRLFKPDYPLVAFEVSGTTLTMVRLVRERGTLRLENFAVTPLDPGEVHVSMVEKNVARETYLSGLVRRLAARTGEKKSDRVSLVLSDSTAKVAVLEMESAPRNRREMDRLIGWQLKKVTPFPIDEGRVAYHRFGRPAGGAEDAHVARVLVTIMRNAVLRQYEKCFTDAGLQPGLVDISTNNLYNLFLGKFVNGTGSGSDRLLVNCEDDGLSLVILHGGVPILYRTKAFGPATGSGDYDYDRVVREVRTSVLYYHEKLGRSGLAGVLVRGTGFHILELRDRLEAELSIPAEVLDPAGEIDLRTGLTLEPGVLQQLAPAIGAAVGR